MLSNYETEMRQRLTRVESRICRIADSMGIRTADPVNELRVIMEGDNHVGITSPVLDVTIADVLRFLTKHGIEGKVANVYFQNRLVARVYPAEVCDG